MEATKPKRQIRWLPEHYAFIEREYPTHTIYELSAMFEAQFGLRASPSAISWKLCTRGIRKTPPRKPRTVRAAKDAAQA